MALTRAQLIQGNQNQGYVLPGQVQGITSGPGLTINADGTMSVNSQTIIGVMKLGQSPATASAAFNNYTWPTATGTLGQQLTITGTSGTTTLAWSDPDQIAWTAKGQLVVGTGAGTQALLNAGANTAFLLVDNNTSSGLSWSSSSTSAALLPVGDLAARPSGVAGQVRFNTTSASVEFFDGTTWQTPATVGSTGTVTNVATGTGLTGGPITTTGTVSLANTAVAPGSYVSANITVDAQGRITSAANGAGGGTVTAVTGTTPIVSSGGATPDISLATTAVTPGSYISADITVDSYGRITAASSGGSGTVTAVTGTAPIVSSGGAAPDISLSTTAVTPGAYTSADITIDAFGRITAAANGISFPAGTRLVFAQASAPTGWVQDTSAGINDRAIRVVNTAGGGTGGTIPFSTLFSATSAYTGSVTITSGQVGDTSLSIAQLAAHDHTYTNNPPRRGTSGGGAADGADNQSTVTGSTGSGDTHTHTLIGVVAGGNFTSDFNLNYTDVIICVKS